MDPAGLGAPGTSPDAEEFVRFCYRRRRVGWPELYDEMCAVATRGSFRGMGRSELAELGIGFSLFETPRLAELVRHIVADEQAHRRGHEGLNVVRIEGRRAAGPSSPAQSASSEAAEASAPARAVLAATGA